MSSKDLFLDSRLQEKSIRDGKLSRSALQSHIEGLSDSSENVLEYDQDGNVTNLPVRELKSLEVKPAAPEPKVDPIPAPFDALADAWETPAGR